MILWRYLISLSVFLILFSSCAKNVPDSNNLEIADPPPVQPSTPSNNNCGGYWICIPADVFKSTTYILPAGSGAFGAATSIGSKVFFGGGQAESYGGPLSCVYFYDTSNQISSSSQLSISRTHLSAASCGNKALFAGGNDDSPPYSIHNYYDAVDIYDTLDYSHTTAHLSEARGYMASASTADKAYFIGGEAFGSFSSNMDVYDWITNSWSVVTLPHARADAGAVVAENKIFIAGGKNSGGNLSTIDVYGLQNPGRNWRCLMSIRSLQLL